MSLILFVIFNNEQNANRYWAAEAGGFGCAKHVLVLGLDGFGGLYMDNSTGFLPNVAYVAGGASTYRARDVMPSVSGPNW